MAFGGGLEPQQEMLTELNMTPLVDVMLVLLILFMITMPLLTQTVSVNLPVASEQSQPAKVETIALAIDKEGNWYWQQERIDQLQMQQRLSDMINTQPVMHLHADQDVPYRYVIQLISLVQQSGIQQLGFVTLPPQ